MQRAKRVRLLCANVAGHYFSKADPPDLFGRLSVIASEIEILEPDVVCVQELYAVSLGGLFSYESERSHFCGLMAKLGFKYASPRLPWLGMDSGLLIFCRSQPENVVSMFFQDQDHRLASKGLLRCKLCVGDAQFVIVNAHLSWGAASPKQICELRKFVADLGNESVVVCGDFNRKLRGSDVAEGFGDCAACDAGPTHSDQGFYDHVFGRKAMAEECRVLAWKEGNGKAVSDHYFVVCNLAFQTKQTHVQCK
jgi:endonuclease/exonuclease/phosphatase family metal-dependent hydrolase